MSSAPKGLGSVCVFCASSNAAAPQFHEAAAAFGRILAAEGLRLVYGGGTVGLMGACAMAAQQAGGDVLGVIPEFLVSRERPSTAIKTVVVKSMHERKMRMFQEADAFAVLPGGIGTLEEVIELLSWRRLGLHAKPMVFLDLGGFWTPLFELFDHITAQNLVPAEFAETWRAATRAEDILPTLRAMPTSAFAPQADMEEEVT